MAKKVFNKALGVASFGLLGSKLLGGKKKSAAAKADDGPKVMPLADDEAVMRARRLSIQKQMGRGGRTSTMLTEDSDTLGA